MTSLQPLDPESVVAALHGAATRAAGAGGGTTTRATGARSDGVGDGAAAQGDAGAAEPALGRVLVVPETASTSTDLVRAAAQDPASWPDRSVLVADHQSAGRGRSGRTWTTPPGSALTVSVLLRPDVPVERWGWVPLLAGLAVVRAVAEVTAARPVLKWPNDVLVADPEGRELAGWGTRRKIAGVLGDMVPGPTGPDGRHGRPAVVVGMGVNVGQGATELPVPSATSLVLATGTAPDRTELLAAVVGHLLALDARWRAAGGDAVAAGLAAECAAVCVTLGSPVEVDLPGGPVVQGRATALGDDGSLEVRDELGTTHTVLAGDVRHVRLAADAGS